MFFWWMYQVSSMNWLSFFFFLLFFCYFMFNNISSMSKIFFPLIFKKKMYVK